MTFTSLGKKVSASKTQVIGTKTKCALIIFEPIVPDGAAYVGDSTLNTGTGAGVIFECAQSEVEDKVLGGAESGNPIDASQFYYQGGTANCGFYVTIGVN